MSVALELAAGAEALRVRGLGCGPLDLRVGLSFVAEGGGTRWSPGPPRAVGGGRWRFTGAEAELELAATPSPEGVVLAGVLTARVPLALGLLSLARLSGPALEQPGDLRFFRQGYASWTPTGAFPGDFSPPRALARSFALANHPVDSPHYSRVDGLSSCWFTVLERPRAEAALLAGFLTSRAGLGELFLQRQPATLHATLDYGGKRLAAGATLALEPLVLAWGPSAALIERFVEDSARAMGVDVELLQDRPVPTGWCSWYHFYTDVTEEDVLRNAAALAQLPELDATVVQLDDGYQTAVGDWRSFNEKFPRGLAPLAREIRAGGRQAGLWLAPFMLSRRSVLARAHPEWLLRDARGEVLDSGFNPAWGARLAGLDLSHPGVLAWLGQLFRSLVEDGFDYFKLDFLYAGLRTAARHDPTLSPVEAYRLGVMAIREAVGPDRFLLGCGAPLAPSVGLFDAMRVSADVKEEWFPRLLGLLGRDAGVASLKESVRNNMSRAFLHRRAWLNDPDCLLLRDLDTALSEDETRLLVTVIALGGGLLVISDDLASVPAARRALLQRVLPPTPRAARCLDLLRTAWPRLLALECPGRRLVACVNWEGRDLWQALPEPRSRLSRRFDQWALAPVLEAAVEVPAHGVRVVLETEPRPWPTVVGTSLHLTALVDGRITEVFAPGRQGGVLRVSARDLSARAGDLWVAVPPGLALDSSVLPPSVVGARSWASGVVLQIDAPTPWSIPLLFSPAGRADPRAERSAR